MRTLNQTIALLIALACATSFTSAQTATAELVEAPATTTTSVSPEVAALQRAGEVLRDDALARLQPLAEGQMRVLEAVVMSVKGRAQWRQSPTEQWRKAETNDLLRPGAMIRTGRRSQIALRIGHNASVLVDRNTRVVLPEIVMAGDKLRTAVELRQGRADFKVDRVGLINDFTVVTPSTTLAVRGTAWGIQYGGLNGTTVTAARTNEIRSIEVKYFLTNLAVFLSAADGTSDAHPSPTAKALFKTFGPPRYISLFIEDPDLLQTFFQTSPVRTGRTVDTRTLESNRIEDNPIFGEIDDTDDGGNGDGGEEDFEVTFDGFPLIGTPDATGRSTAEFICEVESSTLFDLVSTFDVYLEATFRDDGSGAGNFNFPGVNNLYSELGQICSDANDNGFTDATLDEILNEVAAYCIGHFGETSLAQDCVDLFTQAARDTYAPPGGP